MSILHKILTEETTAWQAPEIKNKWYHKFFLGRLNNSKRMLSAKINSLNSYIDEHMGEDDPAAKKHVANAVERRNEYMSQLQHINNQIEMNERMRQNAISTYTNIKNSNSLRDISNAMSNRNQYSSSNSITNRTPYSSSSYSYKSN